MAKEKFSVEEQQMTPKQVAFLLRAVFRAEGHPQPVCLCGAPGIAKSQVIQQVCREFGVSHENGNYHEIRAANVVDSSDLMGLPVIMKKLRAEGNVTSEYDHTTQYSISSLLPIEREGMSESERNKLHVIFFDEINRSSDPAIMNAIFQLTTEFRVGPHKLLPNTIVLLALNPEAEGYLVNSMDPAFINRINFWYMRADYAEWKEFAEAKGLNQGVIDFLNDNRNMLSHDGILKNENQDKRFPTPRAWENVSKALDLFGFDFKTNDKMQQDMTFKVISGIVGIESAMKFITFMRTQEDDKPIPGSEVVAKYLSSQAMQNKIKAKNSKGVRTYDTTKVQITIEGIQDIIKNKRDSLTEKQLLNTLAFLCDIPVEQSMSFQNMLTTAISADFTNWFFQQVTAKPSLNKLWKVLQEETRKFANNPKATDL